MVTRIKVLFAIGIFVIITLISNAIFGENGIVAIRVLQNNVDNMKRLEERKKEELGFLRESSDFSYAFESHQKDHVLSFEQEEVFQPEVSNHNSYVVEYDSLSLFESALIGVAVSCLFVIIDFVARYIKGRKKK